MRVSDATIYRVLKRHGVSRLPGKVGSREVHTKRYHKQVPDHHIQMDVKPLIFNNKAGKKLKGYQCTAIDDAMRVRGLKIYDRHTQKSAIAFVDHVIAKFPFCIQQIRTDRGHEFQAQCHWHVEDGGIRQAYIKPRPPQLNGKVGRSQRSESGRVLSAVELQERCGPAQETG